MNAYESSGQESGESVDERRAHWEQFTMVVLDGDGGGYINVRNDSHDTPDEHIHSVHVANGSADGCSCPHAVHRNAHCKHQRAVEHRPLVLSSAAASAATTGQQVATDGGTQQVAPTASDTDEQDADGNQAGDNDEPHPQTDHWNQSVTHFDDGAVGAGEKCQCQSCGARFEVAMVAATEENSRNWEEFYECQQCGATGSFRFYGERDSREWTGRIAYPNPEDDR